MKLVIAASSQLDPIEEALHGGEREWAAWGKEPHGEGRGGERPGKKRKCMLQYHLVQD